MKKTVIALLVVSLAIIGWHLVRFWPDGKLHIVFCDVGQGDSIYIRFPSNHDMIIDGGPDKRVLSCLRDHMPFFDRKVDIVMLTHPQADHLNGLIEVLGRYQVDLVVLPPVGNSTAGFQKLSSLIQERHIPVKNLYSGTAITIDQTRLDILWPEKRWALAHMSGSETSFNTRGTNVLGASTLEDLNHFSIIAHLSYGLFDVLLTGDSDAEVEQEMVTRHISPLLNAHMPFEVLKVPHHGSRTGMLKEYMENLRPLIGVIEVGAKNRYGHPTKEALDLLNSLGTKVFRTDQDGTVEVVSDGKSWNVKVKSQRLSSIKSFM